MLKTQQSPTESFLNEFHSTNPGVTSRSLGNLQVEYCGREFPSTYAILTNIIPQDNAPRFILDLACGDGFLLSMLAERNDSKMTLHGVDMCASELAIAAARLTTRATLHHANARSLPVPADTYHFVLCHFALMLMDEVEIVLKEVRRVLKSGGVFAAIVGGRPSQTPAFVAYIEALKRCARLEQYSNVRFGDRRVRTCDGIQSLLATDFKQIEIAEITRIRQLTPDELWASFSDMYDLYLLAASDREIVKNEFLEAAAMHVDEDGKLEHVETSRLVTAEAATRNS
ncbi:MAG: class I SAM-dependent methyltransferase [Gammaproteobacteria bacterium]|nr:class I SAM-dependent methyltransferase [Gammaproteobacteria bacterium]